MDTTLRKTYYEDLVDDEKNRSGFEFPAHRFGGTGGMMNSSGRLQIKYTFVRKNRLDYNFTRVAARCSSGGFGGA
jgi:hypothetical protein